MNSVGQATNSAVAIKQEAARTGGDVYTRLSASDIDLLSLPMTLSANFVLDCINSGDTNAIVNAIEHERSRSGGKAAVPFLTRSHWTLLAFSGTPECSEIELHDSAPSPPVLRDAKAFALSLYPRAQFRTAIGPKQVRGSNECGLFCAANAICFAHNLRAPRGYVSLNHWRKLIAEGDNRNLLATLHLDLLDLLQSVQSRAGGAEERVYINVDDTPELESAVSDVKKYSDLLADAEASVKGAMLSSENLDALVDFIRRSAPKNTTVVATCDRIVPATGDFLKPIHIGPTKAGHFVLLALVEDRAHIVDSLPNFRPNEAVGIARKLLFASGNRLGGLSAPIELRVVTQKTNECGFVVAEQIARLMGVPPSESPRNRWGPELISLRREQKNEAEKRLATINAIIAEATKPAEELTTSQMTVKEVRTRVRELDVDSIVEVEFEYQTELASWLGRITRRGQPGLPVQVSFSHQRCECGLWRAMAPPCTNDLPAKGVKYNSLTVRSLIQDNECCDCADDVIEEDCFDPEEAPSAAWVRDVETGTMFKCQATSALPTATVRRHNPYTTATPVEQTKSSLYEPLGIAPHTGGPLRGNALSRIFVHASRPPHIPKISWEQMATSTRQAQRRWLLIARSIHSDLHQAPLGTALVETILRMGRDGNWAPATISKAFSDLTSALRLLPLFTNAAKGINIREDTVFDTAMRKAQAAARNEPARVITPMTEGDFQKMNTVLQADPIARTFLVTSWFLAGRLGDVRQLDPKEITLDEKSRKMDALFRKGKGAHFRGPYHVSAVLPQEEFNRIKTVIASRAALSELFTPAEQNRLSKLHAVKLEARSIRKGRLIHLAEKGASDADLMSLSGHTKVVTLHRYLNRGLCSNNGSASRLAEVERSGGEAEEPTAKISAPTTQERGRNLEPSKMGVLSGMPLDQGRRYRPPPPFFFTGIPSAEDLGIESPSPLGLPLHVKPVEPINFDSVRNLIAQEDERLQAFVEAAISFAEQPTMYYKRTYNPAEVPMTTSFSNEDINLLLKLQKIEHHSGAIFGTVKAFTVVSKEKRRPIFEPSSNRKFVPTHILSTLPPIPALQYSSRKDRRVDHKYVRAYDFSTYYDQLPLSAEMEALYVFRAMHNNKPELFHLKRVPMGGNTGPLIAQAVTWALLPPWVWAASEKGDVHVHTMLDNVRFAGRDRDAVKRASEEFLARCRTVGVTINACEFQDDNPHTYQFLGEEMIFDCATGRYLFRNTPKCIKKLQDARAVLSEHSTKRAAASLLGLILFASHTVNRPLHGMYNLMRGYRAIHRDAWNTGWDTKLALLSPALLRSIDEEIKALTTNEAVEPELPLEPATNESCWAVVDASKHGWGAIICGTNKDKKKKVIQLQQNFALSQINKSRFSANAEPYAALQLVAYLKEHFEAPYHILTDHDAIVKGQFNERTGFGGFSANFFLNTLYALGHGQVKFYYVPGELNPADSLSRERLNDWASPIPALHALELDDWSGWLPGLVTRTETTPTRERFMV